jgi:hypothetical protein
MNHLKSATIASTIAPAPVGAEIAGSLYGIVLPKGDEPASAGMRSLALINPHNAQITRSGCSFIALDCPASDCVAAPTPSPDAPASRSPSD